MVIKNIFNKKGKTLQQIMEEFLIEYCLNLGIFNK